GQALGLGIGLGALLDGAGIGVGDLGAGLGLTSLLVGVRLRLLLAAVELGVGDALDVRVQLRLLVLGLLQEDFLAGLLTGERLGLFGLCLGAAHLGLGVRAVRVQRLLLDEVLLLVADAFLGHRTLGVGLADLGRLALRLDLRRAEGLDVAAGVGDPADLERVEEQALLAQLRDHRLGDLLGEHLAVAHQGDDRLLGDDAAQHALELVLREGLDGVVLG